MSDGKDVRMLKSKECNKFDHDLLTQNSVIYIKETRCYLLKIAASKIEHSILPVHTFAGSCCHGIFAMFEFAYVTCLSQAVA